MLVGGSSRGKVTELVEQTWFYNPFSVQGAPTRFGKQQATTGSSSSKQVASKQQARAKWQKSDFRSGGSDLAKILVDATNGCD